VLTANNPPSLAQSSLPDIGIHDAIDIMPPVTNCAFQLLKKAQFVTVTGIEPVHEFKMAASVAASRLPPLKMTPTRP
jgi:hypothetical protein